MPSENLAAGIENDCRKEFILAGVNLTDHDQEAQKHPSLALSTPIPTETNSRKAILEPS